MSEQNDITVIDAGRQRLALLRDRMHLLVRIVHPNVVDPVVAGRQVVDGSTRA